MNEGVPAVMTEHLEFPQDTDEINKYMSSGGEPDRISRNE